MFLKGEINYIEILGHFIFFYFIFRIFLFFNCMFNWLCMKNYTISIDEYFYMHICIEPFHLGAVWVTQFYTINFVIFNFVSQCIVFSERLTDNALRFLELLWQLKTFLLRRTFFELNELQISSCQYLILFGQMLNFQQKTN